jgi:hypothetical protein
MIQVERTELEEFDVGLAVAVADREDELRVAGRGDEVLPPLETQVTETDERRARDDLRRQIARMEAELARLFGAAFPRTGIEWGVAAPGGPRVLDVAGLEEVRDAMADRLADARSELADIAEVEEAHRALVEEMVADPAAHKWVRVRSESVGEPSCRHWHVRPRWGVLGMLAGWWRVKLSSGCPLAQGRGASRAPEIDVGAESRPAQAGRAAPGAVGNVPALRAGHLHRACLSRRGAVC